MLGLNNNAMSTMMTVGVGHSRRYCNTGYDQWTSLKDGDLQHSSALAQSPKGDIEHDIIGWLVFNDSTHDKGRYDCRSGSLPEILQYRVWPVSRTETFNTQVHWLNLPKEILSPTIRQKLIRNRTASRSRSDGRSRRYVQYRADQSQTETIRGVYAGGNGSSCFQAELGGIKFPPPPAPWIHPGLKCMGKEIVLKYKKWGKLKNEKTNYNYNTCAFTTPPPPPA